jgi:hypothetical protein
MATDSTEVAATTPVYTTDQLAAIKSFDDMMKLLADAGVEATEISEYGDGFSVETDKSSLVNVPFGILDYKFSKKGNFGEFAIVRIVTRDGRKLILTDGSTGIYAQCQDFQKRGRSGGIMCPKGITVSEYDYIDETGKVTPAKTFYFSM